MNNIPCFLIPAIVGSICGILGYLLGKILSKNDDNTNELALQAQLDVCLANSKSMSLKMATLESNVSANFSTPKVENFVATTTELVVKSDYDAESVALIMGKKWKQDDLKIVEGIGPKIEELYHAAGIKTWEELSNTSIEKSQEILTAAGDKFKMHNPGSWSKQAKMATEGKWDDLKKWQDSHKGGKE